METNEKVIHTAKGKYGRIQVTLPLQAKQRMFSWVKIANISKAEFFRLALMLGAYELFNNYFLCNHPVANDENVGAEGTKPPGREEDGLAAFCDRSSKGDN